jgi:hypothetical protein
MEKNSQKFFRIEVLQFIHQSIALVEFIRNKLF